MDVTLGLLRLEEGGEVYIEALLAAASRGSNAADCANLDTIVTRQQFDPLDPDIVRGDLGLTRFSSNSAMTTLLTKADADVPDPDVVRGFAVAHCFGMVTLLTEVRRDIPDPDVLRALPRMPLSVEDQSMPR